jgi:hypothetical protein
MLSFRSILAGLGALAVASSPALAAPGPGCLQPPELSALELRALQSRLMVGAVGCRQEEAYNAFVRRFQRELGSAYHQAEGHFRRVHGSQGRARFNQFDTQLALTQEEERIRQGSFFCRDTQVYFREAMALDAGQLARFGVERNVLLPYRAETCSESETRPSGSRPARAARTTSAASAQRR